MRSPNRNYSPGWIFDLLSLLVGTAWLLLLITGDVLLCVLSLGQRPVHLDATDPARTPSCFVTFWLSPLLGAVCWGTVAWLVSQAFS